MLKLCRAVSISTVWKLAIIQFSCLIMSSFAWGQSTTKTDLYLGGGIAIPAGPQSFTDYWNMGFNAGDGILNSSTT